MYIAGDMHGCFKWFKWALRNRIPENSICVQLGDFGLGFTTKENDLNILKEINEIAQKRNQKIYALAGNHDNPDFFSGDYIFSNLELLPDYSFRTLEGKKCLFVGGGISIDRCDRIENVSYWSDEEVFLDVDKIQECDILFTHVGGSNEYPRTFNQLVHYWAEEENKKWSDNCLLSELRGEKQKIDKILELSKPKWHLFGHFHCSHFEEVNGIKTRIVNIEEIYNLKNE